MRRRYNLATFMGLAAILLSSIMVAVSVAEAAQYEDLFEEIKNAQPESTADISLDRNKRVVDPVAYTPAATEVHQAGYLNTSGNSNQPLVFTFSIYRFNSAEEASRSVQGMCDDMFHHLDDLTGEAAWKGTPSDNSNSCVIVPGESASVLAVTQDRDSVLAFYIAGASGDPLQWLTKMIDELNKLDEVRLGDSSWLPDGSWIVQTGPYNITNTARTPLSERPIN